MGGGGGCGLRGTAWTATPSLPGVSPVGVDQAFTGFCFQIHSVDPSAIFSAFSCSPFAEPGEGGGWRVGVVFVELVGGSAPIKAVRRGGRSLGRACAFQGSLPRSPHMT